MSNEAQMTQCQNIFPSNKKIEDYTVSTWGFGFHLNFDPALAGLTFDIVSKFILPLRRHFLLSQPTGLALSLPKGLALSSSKGRMAVVSKHLPYS
jgi:hypothetical protein